MIKHIKEYDIKEENYNLLLEKYMPLIKSVISSVKYKHNSNWRLEYDDCLNAGMLALFKAIQTYDPTSSVYFGYYLKICLHNDIFTFARDYLPHYYVKVDNYDRKTNNKFKRHYVKVDSINQYEEDYNPKSAKLASKLHPIKI